MPTFIFTPRETQVVISALNTPVGVAKVDRPLAQALVDRMRNQTCTQPQRPAKTHTGYIRSPWPTNHILPEKKVRDKTLKVLLPKTTTPKQTITVADVLKGLL